ncbi:MAG: tetratricopeptide repeat protein [Sporichthyaceae bacterium]|nr:tetratricopeptide repeat protein [Sporichthyaceae bacterium]
MRLRRQARFGALPRPLRDPHRRRHPVRRDPAAPADKRVVGPPAHLRAGRAMLRSVPLAVGLGTAVVTAAGLAAEAPNIGTGIRIGLTVVAACLAGGVAAVPELVFARAMRRERESAESTAGSAPVGWPGDEVPNQLPPSTRHFIGRADVLAELTELLRRPDPIAATVVAIYGKGGVGKTVLAVRVAHAVVDSFPAEKLVVVLRGPQGEPIPPDEAVTVLLSDLGVEEPAIPTRFEDRLRLYNARMAGRRALLLLDNAVDEAQVRPLIPNSPDCAVLVTSRRPLEGLVDARHVGLDVISEDEAIQLLGSIVDAGRVGAEPEAARAIVRLAGSLPLTVAIAGAKLVARPHWRLATLAERLRDNQRRLSELQAGDVDFRACVGLSYSDIGPEQRRAFRLLGIVRAATFRSWTLAPLLDVDLTTADWLADELVRAQLLEPGPVEDRGLPRFRQHDLIRDFAGERAGAEEPETERRAALRRLFGAYLALAECACQADEHAVASAGPAVAEKLDAVRAPRWRTDDPEFARLSQLDPDDWYVWECRPIARAVRQAHQERMWDLAWELAVRIGMHVDRLCGFWNRWEETFELALDAAHRAANRYGQAALRHALGEYLVQRDRFTEAEIEFQRSAAMFVEIGDQAGQAKALISLGETRRLLGGFRSAEEALNRALELAREHGDRWLEAGAWRGLGGANRTLRRLSAAEHCHRQALNLYHELGARSEEGRTLRRLAGDLRMWHRLAEAEQHAAKAIEIVAGTGHPNSLARCWLTYGQVRLSQGHYRDANTYIDKAITVFEESGGLGLVAEAARAKAQVRLAEGEPDDASEWMERGLAIRVELGQRFAQARGLRTLGEIRAAQGRYPEADSLLTEAAQLLAEYGDEWGSADALRVLADVHAELGRWSQADTALTEAVRIFARFGDRRCETESLIEQARLYERTGDREKARARYAQAHERARTLRSAETDPVVSSPSIDRPA